jgi:lysyl-tRNA synthetase class 1
MPRELEEHLLKPVSLIPDLNGCHESFAAHMSGMLRDGLEKAGIECRYMSGRQAYASGLLAEQIHAILLNARSIGEKIEELTGQAKFKQILPYFAVCRNCGRIYTTQAYEYDPERKMVRYRCVGVEVRRRLFKGCGYEGEADIRKDDGKLAWKTEFAARWATLDVRFEAYGKDIADSVKVNDWVSREVLGFEPPLHVRYEMFLDASGRKISKSLGNVFTPQLWYRYGTPQSLLLLLFKRAIGTRVLTLQTIPKLMDELDYLEDVYFDRVKVDNELERARLKGLYLYSHLLRPPEKPSSHIPYSLIVELALVTPEGRELKFIAARLRKYGYELDDGAMEKIRLAINYARDLGAVEKRPVELSEGERRAIMELIKLIEAAQNGEEVQSAIFQATRGAGLAPKEFFKKLYVIFLGRESGPRLGPFLWDLGKDRALAILRRASTETEYLYNGR